jgi:MerR family transcriptional regulator, copper efflux regulator
MPSEETTMGIGALSRASGVGIETLRYYERIGLLTQPGRKKGAYRRYGPDAITRLRFIRRAAVLGFSLAETRELLALRAREGAPCTTVREKASQKLAVIEQKLAELTDLRDAVATLVRACRGDKAVEHCTILAALGGDGAIQHRKGRSPWPQQRPPPPRTAAAAHASRASKRASGASKIA